MYKMAYGTDKVAHGHDDEPQPSRPHTEAKELKRLRQRLAELETPAGRPIDRRERKGLTYGNPVARHLFVFRLADLLQVQAASLEHHQPGHHHHAPIIGLTVIILLLNIVAPLRMTCGW
jgi:hypothetical protein